jgi:hypothetical protein
MSFSITADLVVGAVLLPVAVLSLREVKHWRELPFALLPAVFALHQFIEAAVWAGLDGDISAGATQLAVRAAIGPVFYVEAFASLWCICAAASAAARSTSPAR